MRVTIDFGVQLEELATQTPKTFKAIKPTVFHYRVDDETEQLLQQIRNDIEQRASKGQ